MFQRQDSVIKDDYDDGSAIKDVLMITTDKGLHLSVKITNEIGLYMNMYNRVFFAGRL